MYCNPGGMYECSSTYIEDKWVLFSYGFAVVLELLLKHSKGVFCLVCDDDP
jgi:hypothetical protein